MFKISLTGGRHGLSPEQRNELYGRESLPLKVSIRAFWRMLTPYWTSRASLVSWFLLALIIAMTAGAVWLATRFNTWYKDFWDSLQEYNLEVFKYQLGLFAILAAVHVIISVYKSYLISRLSIRWRLWFTERVMQDWLDDKSYYKMQLMDRKTENPDQRISEDLGAYVTRTLSLFLATGTDIAMLVTFGIVLWSLSQAVDMEVFGHTLHLPDGYMFYLAMIYAVCGTVLTFIIGKPLVRLDFRQQRFEADFRFSLIRVRENAESIALYRGEKVENAVLGSRFSNVVKNFIKLIDCQKRLGFFVFSYSQLAVIFPILIAAPMYFAKIITIGSIIQINSAFGKVQESLSTLVDNFSAWAAFKAVVDRLYLYFDSMNFSQGVHGIETRHEGERFAVHGLKVSRPDGQVLCSGLNLDLRAGDSVLIRGQSGCGKSTMIRGLAGIWPYVDGEVVFPAGSRALFLSQKPYLPQGTLREAAGYPDEPETKGATERYFTLLGLEHLIPRLDEVNIWDHILSLGEQQRVAIVRALLIRPQLLFMDEATSAMDEKLEHLVYTTVHFELPQTIIISVGHRTTLVEAHKYMLNAGGLTWTMTEGGLAGI